MDRGVWRGKVHGVAKSQTRVSDFLLENRALFLSLMSPVFDFYLFIF